MNVKSKYLVVILGVVLLVIVASTGYYVVFDNNQDTVQNISRPENPGFDNETRLLIISNNDDESHTFNITLVNRSTNRIFLSKSITVPATNRSVHNTTSNIGKYKLIVETDTGILKTLNWKVCIGYNEITINYEEDRLEVVQFHKDPISKYCRFTSSTDS